jgi:hypothetical protein
MTYTQRMWLRWADRLVVGVSVACLALGLALEARAQDAPIRTPEPPRVDREGPVPLLRFTDPRGADLVAVMNDGTIAFDYGATVTWSRYFVGAWQPVNCRPVWVLTYVNGPGPRRPLFLQGCEPTQAKDE